MKVKLLQDNGYVSETEGNKFGRKGEIVNIDPLFLKLIKDKCKIVGDDEDDKKTEKPLDKMNKADLITKGKEVELDLTDEDYEKLNKADIIKLIQDKLAN